MVEASDRIALARGMQGFQVAAAKHLNRLRGRRGSVFADRYRAWPLSHVRGGARRSSARVASFGGTTSFGVAGRTLDRGRMARDGQLSAATVVIGRSWGNSPA